MGTIYKLIIEDDEGKTTVYPLSQGEISIGRKDGNTIRLMERNVSRRHARLLRSNGAVFVEDLDSYNGIRINGERINGRYEVKEGDLVEIGDYHLALQAAEVEDESPPPPQPSRAEPEGARDQWPLAGTVPDFRLPEEILAGVRQLQPTPGAQKSAPRDTLVNHPTPLAAPTPAVSAPAKVGSIPPLGDAAQPAHARTDDVQRRELPPFPSPGPGSPLFGQRPGSVTELDGRPPLLKGSNAPGAAGKKDLEPLPATQQINVGPQRIAAVPRIVCVSTAYAGKEFALTRPEIIIGRVEDNDIVIEHRSVSRNHAKIVFDGRAHKIIDLQSANGILVNGEEYAMTDLRKGDLIELGHVRFRFVPSGEAFVATEEELREMKEAGVTPPIASEPQAPAPARPLAESVTQPHFGPPPGTPAQVAMPKLSAPSKPHDAADVHTFDPSTAATVTDTPLSALSMGQLLTPQIDGGSGGLGARAQAARPEPALERRDTERSDRNDRRDTVAPRSAALDQRPTEHAVSTRANGASAGGRQASSPSEQLSSARTNVVETEGTLEKPRPKTGLIVGLSVGVVALIAVAVLLLAGPGGDGPADRALLELYKAKNFKAATEYCKTNQGAFKDPATALKICFDSAAQLTTPPKDEPKKDPDPPKPEGDKVDPAGQGDPVKADPAVEVKDPDKGAVAEPPVGDTDEPMDDSTDPRKAKGAAKKAAATKQPDKTAAKAGTPTADKVAKARELHDRGWRSWNAGDASKAIDFLTQCIAVANLPKCHRTLGTVYAQLGDTARALHHYKQYLALDPNASDVPRVRDIIREVESQP